MQLCIAIFVEGFYYKDAYIQFYYKDELHSLSMHTVYSYI